VSLRGRTMSTIHAAQPGDRLAGEGDERDRRQERDLRSANDELRRVAGELDAFCYSVSHDLRAPLRALDGFSRILLAQHAVGLDPEARELIELLRENAVRMGHLIDDLVNLAQLSRQPLTRRQVSIGELVTELVEEVRRCHAGRTVAVEIESLPDLLCDPMLLRRVYFSLIDNAFKYTRPRLDARVEIGSRAIDGECVLFVRDNGVGFDMQYAGQLFGVFQRLHRAEDFEGNGVGLAIVQRVVHRHAGRVWAESGVDRGATFFFTLEGSHDA
jgi:light-regulated signal transduction histidine kinase (bacteriophytochrome)